MTGETLTCDVSGCDQPALARILPTYGRTDHSALRCRDCLAFDLSRDWFDDWRVAIEQEVPADV